MKDVPVFYLRKPWYVLLRYTPTQINKSQYWKDEIKGIRRGLRSEPIEKTDIEKINLSTEESNFIKKANVHYEFAYNIRTGAISQICLIIPKLWHDLGKTDVVLGERIKEYYLKAFRGKSATERTILQEKVNSPLSKSGVPIGEHSTVSDLIAICLCLMAKSACKDNVDDVEEINRILEIIDKLPTKPEKNKPADIDLKLIDDHLRFWRQASNNTIPDPFTDSHWKSYERTDANKNPKASWGIAKSHIYISQQNERGFTSILFKSKYNEEEYESSGIVTYDKNSKYLIAQLIRHAKIKNDTPETNSFFVMRVRDPENQSLLIGHYINYSIHFERFITKTVIWHKVDKSFSPEDLVNADNKFTTIPISIRRFLYSRIHNRLNLPLRGLSNLDNPNDKDRSLHGWVEERVAAIYQDKKLLACVDKYYVCYFYGEAINLTKLTENQQKGAPLEDNSLEDEIAKFIRIDTLDIDYDDDAVAFNATYKHFTQDTHIQSKKIFTQSIFRGKIARENSTVQVFCEQEKYVSIKYRDKSTSGNFILLNFKIPNCADDKAFEIFNSYDYFEGIISGLSDSKNDPLSFRALIIKRRLNNSKRKVSVKINLTDREKRNDLTRAIINYFKNHATQYQIKLVSKDT
ncbi:hypothetical protein [Spirosoma pollinicola]|uniref:Uncharacterized protein n=1 Tax=Spirosoma pollinicola TaxID=2057025 RepID=A0A2K8YWY9_9BACT|nr:hypothetical protein [Spirosoma pollinicola]AUD02146.1 hypothetical protein CWM47_10125 [Spirosoma pollinicola]